MNTSRIDHESEATPAGLKAARRMHTPGPWHWENGYKLQPVNPESSRHVATIVNADGCMMYRDAFGDDATAEQAANLALIAAAPDLLDVAKSILAPDMLTLLPAEYIEKVRAAIAKAEGGAA